MFELGQGEQGVERRLIEFKDSGYQLIAVWDEMKNGVIERVLMLGGLTQFIWNRDNSLLKYRDERYSYYNVTIQHFSGWPRLNEVRKVAHEKPL
jgi:hypothetical protein